MYSGVLCLTLIPYYGFTFNSKAHEVMAVELRSRCLIIMIKYWLVLIIIMTLFFLMAWGA